MKKLHKKKVKNISFMLIVLFSGILILSGCGNKIKKQMENAINDINSGKYSEAKTEINEILKEDSSNSKANLLNNIINIFENAKRSYENKDYIKANEEISKIPNEYNNYNIKNDINTLKNNISKKLNEIKAIDNKINEVNKLINNGNLDEARKNLNGLKNKELTETQKEKINDLKTKLNKKIDQKKEVENKKVEAEKQNKHKEDNTNKNSSNSKTTNNKVTKTFQNQSNIHYVNRRLGIQMELPSNWRGKYYVRESDNTISFCYKAPKKNIVGSLLYIEKIKKDENIDYITMDDMVIKNINGSKYALGVSTDVGTNALDLGEFEIYKEYSNLKKEKGLVYRTIRGIN